MLYPTATSLRERIIRVLAVRASQGADEIWATLNRNQQPVSIQGVYKELRNLQRDLVVVKASGRFDLNLAWILNLVALTDQMFDSHLERLAANAVAAPQKKRQRWQFTTLQSMNEYWGQLMFMLLQQPGPKPFYQWIPRPWFHILHPRSADGFCDAMEIGDYRIKTIVTGETFLEREFVRSLSKVKDRYVVAHAESPFHELVDTSYSLIGDSLITVKVSQGFARELHEFFEVITEASTDQLSKLQQFLHQRGDFSLYLEHGSARVREVRRKMVEYFG